MARLATALALCCAACSAVVGTPIPDRDGTLAGNSPPPATTSTSSPEAGPTTPPPQSDAGSGAASSDSGSLPVLPEASSPVGQDSGPGELVDTGAPSPGNGATGSCGNPACATDGNECGCQATDSAGDLVQMGCQAGGECICLVSQQTTGQPFPENGACTTETATAAQFIASCPCQ